MRFLFEANNKSIPLLKVKEQIEQEKNVSYKDLSGSQRDDFIKACIKSMPNANTLQNATASIVDIIKETNWDPTISEYLSSLPNVTISEEVVDLVYNLLKDNKINYDESKDWLLNGQVYQRPLEDVLYTIKALTFASNQNLQKDSRGNNRYFDNENPLTVKDFFDKNGNLYNADAIQDIIQEKQTKQVNFSDSGIRKDIKSVLSQIAKKNGLNPEQVSQVINKKDSLIKNELNDLLTQLGVKDATKIIDANFEPGKTTEVLLQKILKGLN